MSESQARAAVLLVEDNPDDEELTVGALRDGFMRHEIHVARDGVQALEYLTGRSAAEAMPDHVMPKLVLLDLKLPKIGGVEVLRRIKGNAATVSVPVVVLTSSSLDQDIRECYALGANSYIVKPVAFEQFIGAVRSVAGYWLTLNQPPVGS